MKINKNGLIKATKVINHIKKYRLQDQQRLGINSRIKCERKRT